ncbi:MAG: DUF5680 domain-containing protein [Spirochaetaceae bacterium]|jgi:transcriptional regulator with XRE-family HTH domain|nr:DUF5680 domain-containing protein [Spirochaetaceae bacterium]
MHIGEKLQILRRDKGLSQEKLAELLDVSRQAVAKWEGGLAYPETDKLIQLSNLLGVTIDSLLKDNDEHGKPLVAPVSPDYRELAAFLVRAKKNCYAGGDKPSDTPSRSAAHEISYSEAVSGTALDYLDSWYGGEQFTGEEAVWSAGNPLWVMNYTGRTLTDAFSGDFLKESLSLATADSPFRGPALHRNGNYTYHCSINGGFSWFQGQEEIFCGEEKTFECYFHGGTVR